MYRIAAGEAFDEHLGYAGLGQADDLDQFGMVPGKVLRQSIPLAGLWTFTGSAESPSPTMVSCALTPATPQRPSRSVRIDPDKIEDEFGALAVRDFPHPRDCIAAGDQRRVSSHGRRDLQFVIRTINRINGCRSASPISI